MHCLVENVVQSEDMSPIKPPTRVQELAIHQILSAPVIVAPGLEDMEEEGDSWDPTLLGWLDVRDILAAFVQRKCADACCYTCCRHLLQCALHAASNDR